MGIIAGCRALRNGVGQPYGDLPGHQPYDTYRNYYHFRPYNWQHYQQHQQDATQMGCGTDEQPYTGDTFERAYQETMQQMPRQDKRYLEYSSQGGDTSFEGHERYPTESAVTPQPVETFFPSDPPVDVDWDSHAIGLPAQPDLPRTGESEDSITSSEAIFSPADIRPEDIPDTLIDPATVNRLEPRSVDVAPSPVSLPSKALVDEPAMDEDRNAVESLIDELLPIGEDADGGSENPFE